MPRYQVSLWAEDLKHGWFGFGKPNCYAVLEDGDGNEIGRTETTEAARNPDWVKIIITEADESRRVPLTVKVYHQRTRDSDLLGEATFEATEVYLSSGHWQQKDLENGSRIFISLNKSEPYVTGRVKLQFRGLDIRNVEPGLLGLGRSDPFFELAKKISHPETGVARWNSVYRSESITDHLNPFWGPLEIGLEELCDGNLDAALRFAVFDNKKGGHKLIGSFEASLNHIQQNIGVKGNADREKAFDLHSDKNADKHGLICVLQCEILQS